MLVNKKAVSTFILIILLLCSVIFGALISYLWVMASYYNMPENTTMLITEEVVFPDFPNLNCTYFNVTILNPSNSVSDVNITAIRLTVEGKNEVYDITTTEPETLPFLIKRGTRQSFKCLKNWSNFTGETVKIEPVAANVLTLSYSCQTPNAKLTVQPAFNVEVSVEYFNLTVENSGALNLTISDIMVRGESISNNVTPQLPRLLSLEQSEIFKCGWNWDWQIARIQNINVTIKVKTVEGYETTYTTNELPGAYLYIDEMVFDYSDTSYFNLTISSSQYSTATAVISGINLTLQDTTTFPINETRQHVPFKNLLPIFRSIPKNETRTFECYWEWASYRNTTVTVNVYTEQGFSLSSKRVSTPSDVVWNITDVSFDLDYTDYFLVNVTNMPCSLREITVTQIMLNETIVMQPSATLSNGTQEMFNCSISWKDFRGKTANVTVITTEGSISRLLEISTVGLKILQENPVYGEFYDPTINITSPYINITLLNSNNSLYNVTIIQIIIQIRSDTYIIYNNATYHHDNNILYPQLRPEEYAPIGYPLNIGEKVTFVCSWNYESYLTSDPITVTIYTAEGFQVSKTWSP